MTAGTVVTSLYACGDLQQVVMRGQVDGLIRLMSQNDYLFQVKPVPSAPVATVSILYPVPGADTVDVDHYGSARALGVHLGAMNPGIVAYLGHSRLLGRARFDGLRSGLEQHGVSLSPELVRLLEALEFADVRPAIEELLGLRACGRAAHQFTLLACYNDYLARHAAEVIRSHGLRVPEDIGVAAHQHPECRGGGVGGALRHVGRAVQAPGAHGPPARRPARLGQALCAHAGEVPARRQGQAQAPDPAERAGV